MGDWVTGDEVGYCVGEDVIGESVGAGVGESVTGEGVGLSVGAEVTGEGLGLAVGEIVGPGVGMGVRSPHTKQNSMLLIGLAAPTPSV